MEIDPAGTSAKKIKIAAMDNHGAMPAPASTEALDPATAERSEEPPPGAEGDGGEGSPDVISNLPDAVLGEIISLLPTKDSARTQALASRWRHIWRAAPLNLDLRDLPDDRREALLRVILSAHQGPGRRLCLPTLYLRYQLNARMLRSPALDNLQELEMYTAWPASYHYPTLSQPVPPPPESIFRFSSTLCIATISQCSLPDYMVETLRFPQLRKLALVAVLLSERALHSIIVTSCPVLESLLLNSISGFGRLKITSPSLRSIGIRSSSADFIIIQDAPLLERLLHLDLHMKMQISVISAPKLETLGCIPEFSRDSKIVFGSTVIQGLRINSLTTVVRNVKTLAISMLCFDLDMVIDLMRCFPCLEILYIQSAQSGKPNLWRQKYRSLLRSIDIRLKTIVMGSYRGIKAQVSFAQFFVLNASILESLKLEVQYCDYHDEFFAEQHKILQMEKRASRGALLCFKKKCRHDALSIVHLSDLDSIDPFACGC